jgi:endo-1,4-beta-mannosidase
VGSSFVTVTGRDFVLENRTFRFVGVNLRALAHYGTNTRPGDPAAQLRAAQDVGARVARLFLPVRDISVDETIGRLKRLIDLMDRDFPKMYLIVALTNLYGDVPFHVPGDDGFYQNSILQPGWFHQNGSDNYRSFVDRVIPEFKNSPRIMAYNIGNELKAEGDPEALVQFMHATAQRIRQLDEGRHLVTTGMISTRHAWMQFRDDLRTKLYDTNLLHFITNHSYHGDDDPNTNPVQENEAPSREDDSDLAERLGKPLLIEEAGFVGTNDRTRLFENEMNLLLGSKQAAGYMPWGFMAGGDIDDGDRELGLDNIWHGADWNSICGLLRNWGDRLQVAARDLQPPGPAFSTGQAVRTTVQAKLRPAAGFTAALDDFTLLDPGTPAAIRGASTGRDGLIWWPVTVQLPPGQATGWIAEVAPDGTRLLAAA